MAIRVVPGYAVRAPPGFRWARYAPGARGGLYPGCMTCGLAIAPPRDDSWRYFAARLERWCDCDEPALPALVPLAEMPACGSCAHYISIGRDGLTYTLAYQPEGQVVAQQCFCQHR